MSQTDLILKVLRANKRNGVPNYRFPELRILRYSSRIRELRLDGYNISCERQVLPNGRSTGVFIYRLLEEDTKDTMQYEDLEETPKSNFLTSRLNIFR